ncbi:MAG: SUMF1/EgtB/PvdO family nonheme iron enzyme [Acidobacteria bacterium]|nr:SUMF1/EgtB/PvdO family nonheme iron enzyme [Acidobacteriota bacterium]
MKRVGKYELLEQIGTGGMGTVWKAFHPRFEKYVAVKEILAHGTNDQGIRKRFEHERQVLKQLPEHHNLVSLLDAFEWQGRYFVVMDYIEGHTLRDIIRSGPTPADKVVDLLIPVLTGVNALHQAGFVHRDLKAENVVLGLDGSVVIIDFGLAESISSPPQNQLGTAKYTAPELIDPQKNRGADRVQADLYAVGILAYELVVGEKRFRDTFRHIYRGSSNSLNQRWLEWHCNFNAEAPVLHEFDPHIPLFLSRTVESLMAKHTNNRFRSTEDALRALGRRSGRDRSPVSPSRSARSEPSERRTLVDRNASAYSSRSTTYQSAGQVVPHRARTGFFANRIGSAPQWFLWAAGAVWATLVTLCVGFMFLTDQAGFTMTVQGAPQGSIILVDNAPRGITAHTGNVVVTGVKAGSRALRVVCEGYGEFTTTVVGQNGQNQVVDAKLQAQQISPANEIEYQGPMIYIPEGEFQLGSNDHQPNEKPAQAVTLPAYYIDKFEVTNDQYRRFCEATGRAIPTNPWWNEKYFLGSPTLPVVGVTWDDARAYAQWAGKRLPNEIEWEKAASWGRGAKLKNIWPWGASFDPSRANATSTSPVQPGVISGNTSAYGVFDLAGNVAEWTDSDYQPYPGNTQPDPNFGSKNKVVRGGSFRGGPEDTRTSRRLFHTPQFEKSDQEERSWLIGFRCAISADDPRLTEVLKKTR